MFTLVSYCILPILFAEFTFNFFWASCQYKWIALTHEAYDVLETVLMYVPLIILILSNVTTGNCCKYFTYLYVLQRIEFLSQ